MEGAPRGIERVALAAAVPTGDLLDAAAALVQSIAGQAHDVERVITATASGSSSLVAVLKPVNPSIATTSTPSRQDLSGSPSQVLNTCFDRPSTISSSRAGPVPSRIGVRSMITVTYLSPRRVWRQQCSSTPITRTPSNRCGSSINTRLPSASTASFAVFHDTPRPSATRATVKC